MIRGASQSAGHHDKGHGQPGQLLPLPGAACYPAAEPVCLVHLKHSSRAGAAGGMALIMMCGQPCSGKTTIARSLMSALEERGIAGVLVDDGVVPLPLAQAFAGDCNDFDAAGSGMVPCHMHRRAWMPPVIASNRWKHSLDTFPCPADSPASYVTQTKS